MRIDPMLFLKKGPIKKKIIPKNKAKNAGIKITDIGIKNLKLSSNVSE